MPMSILLTSDDEWTADDEYLISEIGFVPTVRPEHDSTEDITTQVRRVAVSLKLNDRRVILGPLWALPRRLTIPIRIERGDRVLAEVTKYGDASDIDVQIVLS